MKALHVKINLFEKDLSGSDASISLKGTHLVYIHSGGKYSSEKLVSMLMFISKFLFSMFQIYSPRWGGYEAHNLFHKSTVWNVSNSKILWIKIQIRNSGKKLAFGIFFFFLIVIVNKYLIWKKVASHYHNIFSGKSGYFYQIWVYEHR